MNQTLCLGGISPSQLGRERASPAGAGRQHQQQAWVSAEEVRGEREAAEGPGQRLKGLGPLGSPFCPGVLADCLGLASCPETAHSAWFDLVSGSWDRDKPLCHPKLGIGHLLTLPWEGLIWVVACLPVCDPPSQPGKGVGITQHEGLKSGYGRGWITSEQGHWARMYLHPGVYVSAWSRVRKLVCV